MSTKANPTRIGAFVIGAIVLLVALLITFGAGKFFQTTRTFVAFFDGTVAGLTVGSPVTFRGVPIGSVSRIELEFNTKHLEFLIPVYFQVNPGSFRWRDDTTPGLSDEEFQELINDGLRAQLVSQSLVTGQLGIQINILPGTPVRLVSRDTSVREIPTVPSDIERLLGKLENVRIDELVSSAIKLIDNVDALVQSPDAKAMIPEALAVLTEAKGLIASLEEEAKPTLTSFRAAADSATGAFDQGKTTLATVDRELAPTLADARRLARTLDSRIGPLITQTEGMIQRIDRLAASANATIDPESTTLRDLRRTLTDIAAAARSVRSLADQLNRDPSALIRGRR